MKISRVYKIILAWLVFVLLLPVPSAFAGTELPPLQLNKPPLADQAAMVNDAIVPVPDNPLRIFLPFIRNDVDSSPFLNVRDRATAVAYYQQAYAQAPQPSINWTGNIQDCLPGTLGADYQNAVLARINFYRRYAGVPDQITFLEDYNGKAQAAALIMAANQALNHTPPASWLCYTQLGAQGASTSNLALGAYGWKAIDLYIKDPGDGNGAAGHRRWVLYPQTRYMGSGDIPSVGEKKAANALVVIDSYKLKTRPPTRDPFVAWPPAGYIPYNLVYPRWSFSYAAANFENASVSMQSQGQSIPLIQESVHVGYAENTLVWIPQGLDSWSVWPRPVSDRLYHVVISNVVINGVPNTFQYDVIIIDPAT